MSFNTSNAQFTSNDQTNGQDRKKAVGFINVYLPQSDGSKPKLSAFPLTLGNGADALIDWLAAAPENAGKLMSTAEFVYHSAVPANKTRFVLPA